jgi:hypothetical protein
MSQLNQSTFEITPLGAAIVEALPDKKLVNKIQRVHKKTGSIPVSLIFPFRCIKCSTPIRELYFCETCQKIK